MPRILCVEDSEVDRVLIRGLLEDQQEIDDIDLDIVPDAEAALERIAAAPPDLVVTDLVLPGIDGIELLRRIKASWPLVPVVVVTSRGTEEIAVKALQEGASSYVSKSKLASLLVEAVDGVLSAAGRRRGRARLMQVMVDAHASFELQNDRKLFRPLLSYLQDTMTDFGLFDEDDAMRACLAIEEALNNAAEHGNLELDSELRERDFRGYLTLLEQRVDDPRYRDRRVRFEARFSRSESVFQVTDEGQGFDHAQMPDPEENAADAAVSGRGLTLMHTFMDEVSFNDKGNQVRLTKRSPAAQ